MVFTLCRAEGNPRTNRPHRVNVMDNGPLPSRERDEPDGNQFASKSMTTTVCRTRIAPEGAGIMHWTLNRIGRSIARYLERPEAGYEPFTPSDPDALRTVLRPGDVLLVEGNNHISGVIKYLTQSTWSHAALYVGPIGERTAADGEPLVLVEANLGQGVVGAPLSKYRSFHTRICRPVGLTEDNCARVCTFAAERIGFDYDVKNIFDLLRYLFPLPVPQRFRRRMIALGSGHPTRIICSALIAQAFEHVRYPILPKINRLESETARRDILEIRHSSLYAPRDFDISPYFQLVKPTVENGFDYRRLAWIDLPQTIEPVGVAPGADDGLIDASGAMPPQPALPSR
jgi:hypothetical protein